MSEIKSLLSIEDRFVRLIVVLVILLFLVLSPDWQYLDSLIRGDKGRIQATPSTVAPPIANRSKLKSDAG